VGISAVDIVAGSAAAAADKNLVCFGSAAQKNQPLVQKCVLAGGKKKISDGPIAIVRYHAGRAASEGSVAVRIENGIGATADLKTVMLGGAEGAIMIQ
jgi:hypothetical protein